MGTVGPKINRAPGNVDGTGTAPTKEGTNQCNAVRNGCLACLVHSFCDNLFGIKKQLGRKILRGGVPLGEQKLANGNWHGRNHGLRQSVRILPAADANKSMQILQLTLTRTSAKHGTNNLAKDLPKIDPKTRRCSQSNTLPAMRRRRSRGRLPAMRRRRPRDQPPGTNALLHQHTQQKKLDARVLHLPVLHLPVSSICPNVACTVWPSVRRAAAAN